jgi:hypothetical protein
MCCFALLECHHVGRAGIGASPIGSVSRASKSLACEMPILVRGDYTTLRNTRLKVDEQGIMEYSIREGSVTGYLWPSTGMWHSVRRAIAGCTEGTCLGHQKTLQCGKGQDGKPTVHRKMGMWTQKASASSSRFVKQEDGVKFNEHPHHSLSVPTLMHAALPHWASSYGKTGSR